MKILSSQNDNLIIIKNGYITTTTKGTVIPLQGYYVSLIKSPRIYVDYKSTSFEQDGNFPHNIKRSYYLEKASQNTNKLLGVNVCSIHTTIRRFYNNIYSTQNFIELNSNFILVL